MGIMDSSDWHGNDKEILEFQGEYPDIYAELMNIINGDYGNDAVR